MKKLIKLTTHLTVEEENLEKLNRLNHHIDYLFDLESWPEIEPVSDVSIEEVSKVENEKDIFWKVQRQYWECDARQQYEEYCEWNDDVKQLTDEDFKNLAHLFEKYHDCDIDDNSQWQGLIEKYLNEH